MPGSHHARRSKDIRYPRYQGPVEQVYRAPAPTPRQEQLLPWGGACSRSEPLVQEPDDVLVALLFEGPGAILLGDWLQARQVSVHIPGCGASYGCHRVPPRRLPRPAVPTHSSALRAASAGGLWFKREARPARHAQPGCDPMYASVAPLPPLPPRPATTTPYRSAIVERYHGSCCRHPGTGRV